MWGEVGFSMANIVHSLANGIHPGAHYAGSAPTPAQDHVLWVDTSSGPPFQLNVWNAGSSAWQAVGIVSGGSALTQLSRTLLTGTSGTLGASSLPATYNHLQVVLLMRSNDTGASNTACLMQINGDAGSNYNAGQAQTGSTYGYTDNNGANRAQICLMNAAGASNAASVPTSCTILFAEYRQTTFHKTWVSHAFMHDQNSANRNFPYVSGGAWLQTTAINALSIFPAAGSFVAGSSITVYGLT